MKIGILVFTPAQLHFYKIISTELNRRGHETLLLVSYYGESVSLLNEFGISYRVFSKPTSSKLGKIFSTPKDLFSAYLILNKWHPDILCGSGMFDGILSSLLRISSVSFNDSEHTTTSNILYQIQFAIFSLFTKTIVTPIKYKTNLGSKQVRINSYKELAYLHPKYYVPDDNIYSLLNIVKGTKYIILRFNSFDAVHDVNQSGFSNEDKIELTHLLSKYAHVFISAEGTNLPVELTSYLLPTPKNRIHDVIYFAEMVVTDTQTMATEAALLGTPVIRSNSFVGENDMSNFRELEDDYGLIYNISNRRDAIKKAEELILEPHLKDIWREKREHLISEKEDMCSVFVDVVEMTYNKQKY